MVSIQSIRKRVFCSLEPHVPYKSVIEVVLSFAFSSEPVIRNLKLMNNFVECMSNPWFTHDSPGYWLMHIDGTHSSKSTALTWSDQTIKTNDRYLDSLQMCHLPFVLCNGTFHYQFPSNTTVLDFIYAQTPYGADQQNLPAIPECGQYFQSDVHVSAVDWLPIVTIN